MPGSALLDTTTVIALFAADKAVCDRIARASVLVSSTVLGELFYGALKSARSAANLARIEEFAASVGVLACDAATARHYAHGDGPRARERTDQAALPNVIFAVYPSA